MNYYYLLSCSVRQSSYCYRCCPIYPFKRYLHPDMKYSFFLNWKWTSSNKMIEILLYSHYHSYIVYQLNEEPSILSYLANQPVYCAHSPNILLHMNLCYHINYYRKPINSLLNVRKGELNTMMQSILIQDALLTFF